MTNVGYAVWRGVHRDTGRIWYFCAECGYTTRFSTGAMRHGRTHLNKANNSARERERERADTEVQVTLVAEVAGTSSGGATRRSSAATSGVVGGKRSPPTVACHTCGKTFGQRTALWKHFRTSAGCLNTQA
jgi:hypothetical protein